MQPSASDQRSIEERVARISKLIALQPQEDPTGPSFYDICNDIHDVDNPNSLGQKAEKGAIEAQLAKLKSLRPSNVELLKGFFVQLLSSNGDLTRVESQADVASAGDFYVAIDLKSDKSIMAKITRPKVLEEYPQYKMRHIRDALRFKVIVSTVLDAFVILSLLVDETQWAERGVHAVKVDVKKFLKPKKFGWRFIGCDLKMPNGLLVECYIAFAELMAVDRGNHIFFEKWRGKDLSQLTPDERRQYEADAQESTKRYNQAFCEILKRTTQNQFAALFAAFPPDVRARAVQVFRHILHQFDMTNPWIEEINTQLTAAASEPTGNEGQLSREQLQRAKDLLSYAYYGAGFCLFRLRKYEEAKDYLETSFGDKSPTRSADQGNDKPQQYAHAKERLFEATHEGMSYENRRGCFIDAIKGLSAVVDVDSSLSGLSDQTAKKARKFGAYCLYALGKKAMRAGKYLDARKHFQTALDEHHEWLALWDAADKDYAAASKMHLKDCETAIAMAEQEINEETEIVAWAKTNRLIREDAACTPEYLVKVCKLPAELSEELDVDTLRDAEEGEETEELLADLQDLHEKVNKMKAKKLMKEAKKQTQIDEVKDALEQLGITSLGDLLVSDKEYASVRAIFDDKFQRGKMFDTKFARAKAMLSLGDHCKDTLDLESIGTLSLGGQGATLSAHTHTKNLFQAQTRALNSGNPTAQAKFDRDISEMEAESAEEEEFKRKATEHVAGMMEQADAGVKGKNRSAEQLQQQIIAGEPAPGSIILHMEFTGSKHCTADEMAELYCQAVLQMSARWSDADADVDADQAVDNPLGFMPAETLQLLSETGVLDEFARPLRERQADEKVVIWRHGEDEVTCTIACTLGKGAQGYVYETSPLQSGGVAQALKCGRFNQMKNEALIFLKLNYPRSHPHVLRAHYVHALDDSNGNSNGNSNSSELLCLMERVEGPSDGVRDLEQAIKTGLLFEGEDKVVDARLLRLVLQLAFAIEYVHSLGIVHMDVKPANILLDRDWRVVLMDFGVSSIGEPDAEGGVAGAELKGCTPTFCGPEHFAKFELACTAGEKQQQQCTHYADVFCFVSTVLEMYSGSIDGKWRAHRPLRMTVATTRALPKTGYFSRMPAGLLTVLQEASSSEGGSETTMRHVVDKLLALECAGVPKQRASATEGIHERRINLMYDRIGAALYDRGAHDRSLEVYGLALALQIGGSDARLWNNKGVVLQAKGEPDEAKKCFDSALGADPDHTLANFNVALALDSRRGAARLDRSGAAGAVEDSRGKVELAEATKFATGQQLEVYRRASSEEVMEERHRRWEEANPKPPPHFVDVNPMNPGETVVLKVGETDEARQKRNEKEEEERRQRRDRECEWGWEPMGEGMGAGAAGDAVAAAGGKPRLLLHQRPAEKAGARPVYYALGERLLVYWGGEWRMGSTREHVMKAEFEQEVEQAEGARAKAETAAGKAKELQAARRPWEEAKQFEEEAARHRWYEGQHWLKAQELASRHAIAIEGQGEATLRLDSSNHAPALFTDLGAMSRAQHAHTIELKDKHAFILDLFSGQQLNTRTQTATLRYREAERAAQTLSKNDDVDAESYQMARKASMMSSGGSSVKATTILQEMLGGAEGEEEEEGTGAKAKTLHSSYVAVQEDYDKLTSFGEQVDVHVSGWEMGEQLPKEGLDQDGDEWWGVWEAMLKSSDGVVVAKTKLYDAKLSFGACGSHLSKSERAEAKAEARRKDSMQQPVTEAGGKGLYREAQAILQRRKEEGDKFAVYVVDDEGIEQEGSELVAYLEGQDSEANVAALEQLVNMSPERAKELQQSHTEDLLASRTPKPSKLSWQCGDRVEAKVSSKRDEREYREARIVHKRPKDGRGIQYYDVKFTEASDEYKSGATRKRIAMDKPHEHEIRPRRRYLLLILGPAASGKTTLLKTFMMEMVHTYTDFVPVLMPVIEMAPVLDACNRDEGESVVVAFIRRKYPQHAHLLLQMMLMRRAVFLVDGIDESGTYREAVQDFITLELLEPGHRTVITSRHSGFSSDAFKQCRLVELLPLSADQQAEMVRTRVPDDEKAKQLVDELGTDTFKEIASSPLMLTMMISVYVSNGFKLISNRSELYEKALRTIMGRTDKGRAGLELASQAELLEHLQKLASGSHRRNGERRIFNAGQAQEWANDEGWSAIEGAMRAGRLPIIARLGPNEKDEEEYRFGHMSYQEYLTGREYYQKLTASHFAADTMVELFGQEDNRGRRRPPQMAFTDVKQHLMLQLLAGILSPEQRTICLAAMAGGRVEVQVPARKHSRRSMTSLRCAVVGCSQLHRNADGYCHNHRAEAAIALAKATVHGGETLSIIAKSYDNTELGRAGAEALAPYLRDNSRLQSLVLQQTKLGADGMRVLADALKTIPTLTQLGVSGNELGEEGAQAVAEVLAESVAKIASVNVLGNDIGEEQAQKLIEIMEGKDELKTLCGFSGEETKVNLIGKGLSAGCAVLIGNELKNHGALTTLDISNNNLGADGAKHIAAAIPTMAALTTLHISNAGLGADGAKHIAAAIPTMAALTALHIFNNSLGADGAKHIAAAIPTMASLTTLDISYNKIPEEEVKALSALCASKGIEAPEIETQQ